MKTTSRSILEERKGARSHEDDAEFGDYFDEGVDENEGMSVGDVSSSESTGMKISWLEGGLAT